MHRAYAVKYKAALLHCLCLWVCVLAPWRKGKVHCAVLFVCLYMATHVRVCLYMATHVCAHVRTRVPLRLPAYVRACVFGAHCRLTQCAVLFCASMSLHTCARTPSLLAYPVMCAVIAAKHGARGC